MRELYLYYRVAAPDAARAAEVVRGWQRALAAQHPALRARLLRRAEDEGAAGDATWMETYAAEPAGLDDALLALLAAGPPALAPLLAGTRHAEAFVACAS